MTLSLSLTYSICTTSCQYLSVVLSLLIVLSLPLAPLRTQSLECSLSTTLCLPGAAHQLCSLDSLTELPLHASQVFGITEARIGA